MPILDHRYKMLISWRNITNKTMTEDSMNDESGLISRRSAITHIGAIISGWFIGSFLDPFRRFVNSLLLRTPFGRQAQVSFAYTDTPDKEDEDYMLIIGNSGEETAENVYAHVGFEERINTYDIDDWVNSPPSPDVEVEIVEGGLARIKIDFLRREYHKHFNPVRIYFSVNENTEGRMAYRIEEGDDIFLAYRYSWTFLGERYYESTEHHIGQTN